MSNRRKILNPSCNTLVLAEGMDAQYFLMWALQAYNIENIQVESYGGITELTKALATWKLVEGFNRIETLIIARDAETNAKNAITNVQKSLTNNNFPSPNQAFAYSNGTPKVAIIIFPGIENGTVIHAGSLEDLCLRSITMKNDIAIEKSNDFIDEINMISPLTWPHKSKLHAYLSVKNDYVGMKIGEAAKSGAWNWEAEAMQPFRQVLVTA